jgi:hypothetical protein
VNERNLGDRLIDPLVATSGAPGSGKTFLLRTVTNLDKVDLEKFCEDDRMRSILEEQTVAVFVTYNSATPDRPIDVEDPETGLALRLLYQ